MLKLKMYINDRQIGELKIVNDGTGIPRLGNYWFTVYDEGLKKRRWRGTIKEHNRDQSAWELVTKALKMKFKGE